MSAVTRLRTPWLAGALLLLLAAGVAVPAAYFLGWRTWSVAAGLAAVLLLLFGGIERLWQRHALARPSRSAKRGRLRLVSGGKRKGNGQAHDAEPDEGEEGPRWVM
jgi:protein-S-isoprenylcysteine O-methyltransferase Ste14